MKKIPENYNKVFIYLSYATIVVTIVLMLVVIVRVVAFEKHPFIAPPTPPQIVAPIPLQTIIPNK